MQHEEGDVVLELASRRYPRRHGARASNDMGKSLSTNER